MSSETAKATETSRRRQPKRVLAERSSQRHMGCEARTLGALFQQADRDPSPTAT